MATHAPAFPIFSGRVRHALDAKNRTVIPAAWRPEEPAPLWLVPQSDRSSLLAMPERVFEAVEGTVNANPNLDPEQRQAFLELFFSEAQTVTPDKQGRFVIPEQFCAELKLRNEVLFAGAQSKFKIWNVAAFESFEAERRPTIRTVGRAVQL